MPVVILAVCLAGRPAAAAEVTVGSKAFAESWILGEALRILASDAGVEAEHRSNLGGTEIVYQALLTGAIDVYAEYTGTIAEVLLKDSGRPGLPAMREALAKRGLGLSEPLGFNDSYALAVSGETQRRLGLRTISDLARHPELRFSLSHEFLGRADGWPGLARLYSLGQKNVSGIQHDLAYEAMASRRTDVIDIYTTDAQIERLGLTVLEDDRGYFPRYDAVLLFRLDLPEREPAAFRALQRLLGRIDEAAMIRANARVVLERHTPGESAEAMLAEVLGRKAGAEATSSSGAGWRGVLREMARNTSVHVQMVAVSLLAAMLAGISLGILSARSRALAGAVLALAGVLQTIPSLALLALLIPLLGIGRGPALVALFLYSLLPIVRNTHAGLTTIPRELLEVAEVLGLDAKTQLFRVRLPMASPAILAGVQTSAVINVGTATLAALIGAGGLGGPILQGIALRDSSLILQGAVPAALLALIVQWGFDRLQPVLVPKGLRLGR